MLRISLAATMALACFGACELKAEKEDLSYPEAGLAFSNVIIHPSLGYWWNHTGVRFTGMYWKKDFHIAHFNLGYALVDTKKVQHGLNLLTSWVVCSDQGADYSFWATGIAYSLNYRGFFLEIGLAHPWKDELGNLANDPVVPCGYWGYIYRFKAR